MEDATPTPRPAGRPPGKTNGPTPIRHFRVGALWDRALAVKEPEETMSQMVTRALRIEVERREADRGAR